jgi:hypothetical protein
MSHVINQSLTSANCVGYVQPGTSSHVGGIDSIKKPRRIEHNPNFPCNICKGDHLTHFFPGLPEAQILWSLSAISFDSKSYEVSSHPIQPLVDELVMQMQSLVDPNPLLGGDLPSDHVVS